MPRHSEGAASKVDPFRSPLLWLAPQELEI